jgi:glucose/arabinose dehydrogenase
MRPVRSPTLVFCFLLAACGEPDGPRRPDSGAFDGGRDSGPSDAGAGCAELDFEPLEPSLVDPVQLTAPPGDARLFVAELTGARIRIIRDGQLIFTPFLEFTAANIAVNGDQGLTGLAFHPEYPTDPRVFVSYSPRRAVLRVSSFEVSDDPDRLDAASEVQILEATMPEPTHTAGHIAFGPNGLLYISIGDGQMDGDVMDVAQDTGSLLGKILRVDVDGAAPYAVPDDNPLVGTGGARGEIWAFGLRVPYRFSFDPANGDFYLGEVGDRRFEEIDYEPSGFEGGANYGWPAIEGDGHCVTPGCSPEGTRLPIHEFEHADEQCAVMGGFVYRGNALGACHQGRYFYADYCTGRTFSFRVESGVAVDHRAGPVVPDAVVSWGRDGNGELYALGEEGGVYRLIGAP